MKTYTSPAGDEIIFTGNMHEAKEQKWVVDNYGPGEWQSKHRLPLNDHNRKVFIYTPSGSGKHPWSAYRVVLQTRSHFDFLYDDVAGNLHWPEGNPGRAGKWKLASQILLNLAQRQYPATDYDIAADLNWGQNHPADAVRQAINRINKKVAGLIISTGQGYLLNPGLEWRIITRAID